MSGHIVTEFLTPELRDPPQATDRGCPPETSEQLAEARERDQALYEFCVKHFWCTAGGDLVVRRQWHGNCKPVGSVAGSDNGKGYLITQVLGKLRLNHQLVWLMHHGRLPRAGLEVDHVDRDPLNNRIENMRESSRQFNCLNRSTSDNSLPQGLHRAIMNGGRSYYIRASIQQPGTRKALEKYVPVKPWATDSSQGHPRGWALDADGKPVRAADELQAIEVVSAWWQATQQALYGQAA